MEYIEDKSYEKEKELFIFSLNNKLYSILPARVLEIIKFIELDVPEKLPKDVAGIIKYDSFFINAIDLKSLLGLETKKYTPDNKILIVSLEDSIFAIIVDEIIGNKKIDIGTIQLSPYKTENNFSEAFFNYEGKMVAGIDLSLVDKKIRTSLATEIENNNTQELYPTDPEILALLKVRKQEFLEKEGLEELIHTYSEKDAIIFEINGNKYCTEIENVKYFYKLGTKDKITKIPVIQAFIMGLLNIKGEFITIVDLEKLLNIGQTEIKNNSIIIILETEDYKIGVLADKIGERVNIQEEIERFEANNMRDNKQEFLNFVRDEEVYTVIKPKEIFGFDKFHN